MATAMVLLYRFYCIFVYHVLIILHVYFASWGQLQELNSLVCPARVLSCVKHICIL